MMERYMITESVAGNIVIIKAKTPESALIRYVKEIVRVNPDGGALNFDFEIEKLKNDIHFLASG